MAIGPVSAPLPPEVAREAYAVAHERNGAVDGREGRGASVTPDLDAQRARGGAISLHRFGCPREPLGGRELRADDVKSSPLEMHRQHLPLICWWLRKKAALAPTAIKGALTRYLPSRIGARLSRVGDDRRNIFPMPSCRHWCAVTTHFPSADQSRWAPGVARGGSPTSDRDGPCHCSWSPKHFLDH